MQTYEVETAMTIWGVTRGMVKLADRTGDTVTAKFNGYKLVASHGDDPQVIVDRYFDEVDRGR